MKKKFRFDRKGISTVIATIIIVAIAIVMSIAVAYWVMGIGGSFTRFEKLQFTSAYATSDTSVNIGMTNKGTAPATLDKTTVFANGIPIAKANIDFKYSNGTSSGDTLIMQPGDTASGVITLSGYQPGTTVEIKIQTVAGNQYPQVVTLP
jgi:FlaG/FlaF family flagellin (archaellin)